MKSCFSEVLDEILLRSADAVLETRGVELKRSIPPPDSRVESRHVGGLIPFDGTQIRGSLLLMSTFETTARMRARAARVDLSSRVAADWIVIRDWIGELANQLLGRIKNRLQAFEVNFDIGTPVPLSGPGLALAMQPSAQKRVFAYRRGEDLVQIVIELRQEPQLASTRPATASEPAAREGEVIEF